MKILIPMAGTGNRFVEAGYTKPKPLIDVGGKKIIEYILDMFDDEDEIIFICNSNHIKNTNMKKVLTSLNPSAQIFEIEEHKKGPIYTIMPFLHLIDDEEPVMVCYCDNPFIWNRKDFNLHVVRNKLDGCILTHTGLHPHTLNSTKMAFLKTDKELMTEIKEKECYTDNPMSEHASTGAYYFNMGKIMKECFRHSMDNDVTYNGEHYVTLAYNSLVDRGYRIGFFDTDFVTVFGTPAEVQSFEAWKTVLTSGQVKSERDAIECYRYWKAYHEK